MLHLGLILFLWGSGAFACTPGDTSFCNVQFVDNYDADTLTVNIAGQHPLFGRKAKIRVYGVDTPELRTKDQCEKRRGYKAKKFVSKRLSKAKSVHLVDVSRGKYFRIVAKVIYVDRKGREHDLSEELIDAGLAYEYFGGTKKRVNWCK